MIKANQHELKINGTYQLLIYGDHVDLLNGNTHTLSAEKHRSFITLQQGDCYKHEC
jgi:hypothetical protein